MGSTIYVNILKKKIMYIYIAAANHLGSCDTEIAQLEVNR